MSGHLLVDADGRDDYLETCRSVVDAARTAPGCLDFAISADLQDPARINVLERWEGREPLDAFRGAGISDEQGVQIRSASIADFEVSVAHPLT